jgi:hypothetical protein
MASNKKPRASRRTAASDVPGSKSAVEHPGLPIPDFDPRAFDHLLKDVSQRLHALSRRTSELAGALDTLLRDGSLVGLSKAQSPGDVGGDGLGCRLPLAP